MILSHMIRVSALATVLIGAAAARAATTIDDFVPKDLPISLSGAYLAGRDADSGRDFTGAVQYYATAFANDPSNSTIGERLVTLALADGQMNDAFNYAQKLVAIDAANPIALIALGTRAFDKNQLDTVDSVMAPVTTTALGKLTGGLMSAWASFGLGQVDKALSTVDALTGPSWYGIFKDYSRALILDAANRVPEAATSIAKAYQTDATALKVVTAYARIAARNGEKDKAVKALNDFVANSPVQAPIISLLQSVQQNQKLGPVVSSARAGAAEVLYGLGVAIGTDQGAELPAMYLRLAALLDPTSDLTILSLGDVFQATNRCESAVAIYQIMPKSSQLHRNADLQSSNCLLSLDKPDDAAVYAKRVVDANPKDVEAIIQLGNVYRANERYADAAQAYTRGIEASPSTVDWRILYYRGVSYTMSGQWPQAEADFQRALVINPGQPQVLNYLGYSWVDRGQHLDDALGMIKKAVDQRPNDGFIIDSLGWAYYRLGRYDDAVTQLERAVKLQPEDSTLNDHLGDAYWKVGRKRDAGFQWAHARDFGPDPKDVPNILAKLEHGLDASAPPALPVPEKTSLTIVAPTAATPHTFTVQAGDTLSSIAFKVYGDPGQYLRIYDANRGILRDPNALAPGMILVIPGAASR